MTYTLETPYVRLSFLQFQLKFSILGTESPWNVSNDVHGAAGLFRIAMVLHITTKDLTINHGKELVYILLLNQQNTPAPTKKF